MPELPEVETVARELAPLMTGARATSLVVLDTARLAPERPGRLRGRRVRRVERWGKQVVIDLDGLYLGVHLRMTGRLVWRPGRGGSMKTPHLRARFRFDRGALDFLDVRRFGTLVLTEDASSLAPAGQEPLARSLSARRLGALIGRSTTPIKSWLLRQDKLVGVGNIYACEALFRAGIDPLKPAGELDEAAVARLHRQLRRVLRDAIEACGTTFSDFQTAYGLTGSYQQYLMVYAREGEPCSRCKRPIERVVIAQRSTFYCSSCQR